MKISKNIEKCRKFILKLFGSHKYTRYLKYKVIYCRENNFFENCIHWVDRDDIVRILYQISIPVTETGLNKNKCSRIAEKSPQFAACSVNYRRNFGKAELVNYQI